MNKERDTKIEDNIKDDPREVLAFKYSITSYGADYPVDGLVKRMKKEDIHIPSFQREYVWDLKKASRFVESLLLGLPVPGIFLSKEHETNKLLVIDGQQRLRTLQYFYNGIFGDTGREFALRGVQSNFNDATYKSLSDEDRRRLDDSILHATIVKQDEPSNDDSSIYHIFERLNTGAALLTPQEIRACIYHGEFNELLMRLNKNKSWRAVYGRISPRMRDQELILRFLALYFFSKKYTKPMKEFLNIYMGNNKHLAINSEKRITKTFLDTIEVVNKSLRKNAFRPKKALNAAVYDSVMVGIAKRLSKGDIKHIQGVRRQYRALLKNDIFIDATETATTDDKNVKRRLKLATDAFANVR